MDKFFQNAKFAKIAYSLKDCPTDGKPEIVLAGRSNVGKSSLINSLCYQKNLAKVAATPGKTQAVVYFEVPEHFYLTDLPGYGFSKTGQNRREKFSNLADSYFSSGREIKLVLLLLDSKVGPSEQDLQMLEFLLANNFDFILLLNKIDKLKTADKDKIKREIKQLKEAYNIEDCPTFWISNSKKIDIDSLRDFLKRI